MLNTIDSRFQYQANNIFNDIKESWKEDIKNFDGTFVDWLYKNKDEVGDHFLTRVDEWCGLEEAIENPH